MVWIRRAPTVRANGMGWGWLGLAGRARTYTRQDCCDRRRCFEGPLQVVLELILRRAICESPLHWVWDGYGSG
jgi:hypothetical protein